VEVTVLASDVQRRDFSGPARIDGTAPPTRHWSPRQKEICDQLEEIFLREGFRHLTIADLVDRLHCSRRTLYSLAPSREELVLAVLGRMMNHMGVEARARADACVDPGDAIAAYLDTGVRVWRRSSRAFHEDLESYLPTKHLYDRHLQIALEVLGNLVERGVRQGSFRDLHPRLVAEILDASVDRIRQPDVLARAGVSRSEAIAELSRLFREGLISDARRPGNGRRPARRPSSNA
jgi:AcrR family transcriptional regulator